MSSAFAFKNVLEPWPTEACALSLKEGKRFRSERYHALKSYSHQRAELNVCTPCENGRVQRRLRPEGLREFSRQKLAAELRVVLGRCPRLVAPGCERMFVRDALQDRSTANGNGIRFERRIYIC